MPHGLFRAALLIGFGAIGVATLLIVGWARDDRSRISPEALSAAIEAGNAPHILDVRTRGEYAAGHVPGAIRIPFERVWLRSAALPASRDEALVVYCSHGGRAGLAKLQLSALGYRNVLFLQGQMRGWARRGLPVSVGDPPR